MSEERRCHSCAYVNEPATHPACIGCFGSVDKPNWKPMSVIKTQPYNGLLAEITAEVEQHDAAAGFRGDEDNPKDCEAFRRAKAPLSTVPTAILTYAAMQLHNGRGKYGAHNFRVVGVKFSVYYEAILRHLITLWNGEETDEEGIPNLAGLAANVAILCDATAHGYLKDDRPPSVNERALFDKASVIVKANLERNAQRKVPAHYDIKTPTFKAGA